MFRAAAALAAALSALAPAHAATLTYTSILERWSANGAAIAGAHGSGPALGGSDSQAALSFNVSQALHADDTDLDPPGAFADANAFVTHATLLNANAVATSGGASASALLSGAGTSFATLESELQVEFRSDVDVAFELSGLVDCDLGASGVGTSSCLSYVRLLDGQGQALFDLTTASGLLQGALSGTLRAGESYFVWAWSEASASAAETSGTSAASAGWFFSLTTDVDPSGGGGGGSVAEPSALALLAAGMGGLAAFGHRRRRA